MNGATKMNKDNTSLNRRLDTLYTLGFFISNEEEILTSVKALRSQAGKETFNGFDNEQLEKIKTCLEMSEWHLHELENYTDKRIRLRNKSSNLS